MAIDGTTGRYDVDGVAVTSSEFFWPSLQLWFIGPSPPGGRHLATIRWSVRCDHACRLRYRCAGRARRLHQHVAVHTGVPAAVGSDATSVSSASPAVAQS